MDTNCSISKEEMLHSNKKGIFVFHFKNTANTTYFSCIIVSLQVLYLSIGKDSGMPRTNISYGICPQTLMWSTILKCLWLPGHSSSFMSSRSVHSPCLQCHHLLLLPPDVCPPICYQVKIEFQEIQFSTSSCILLLFCILMDPFVLGSFWI